MGRQVRHLAEFCNVCWQVTWDGGCYNAGSAATAAHAYLQWPAAVAPPVSSAGSPVRCSWRHQALWWLLPATSSKCAHRSSLLPVHAVGLLFWVNIWYAYTTVLHRSFVRCTTLCMSHVVTNSLMLPVVCRF